MAVGPTLGQRNPRSPDAGGFFQPFLRNSRAIVSEGIELTAPNRYTGLERGSSAVLLLALDQFV